MTRRKLVVKQDEEKPVAVEVLAETVVDISKGIRKLRAGPINEKGILLLIQHAAPTKGRSGQRYSIAEIKAVLDGLSDLEATYLKKRGAM